jgi:hypothetical protein
MLSRLLLLAFAGSVVATTAATAGVRSNSPSRFTFQELNGIQRSATIIRGYYPGKIVHPLAKVDLRLDPRLLRAATLAEERAHAKSKERCWRYVKEALLAAGAVKSYPRTAYAKQAGDELVRSYGFKKLSIHDPYSAPVGAVLVYGNGRHAGHVEIRTKTGFVSDYRSKTACGYRLMAVYGKFSS